MHFSTLSMDRAFALRDRIFNFESACSIGFRSGP